MKPTILLPMLLCLALSGAARAHQAPASPVEGLSLTPIGERVYVVEGLQGLPTPDNAGFMSNTGIVLTGAGVVIVDSGGSGEVARAILAQLPGLTDLPVIAVFNSHVHGDHWLGNAAVRDAFPEVRIYAHARAIERLGEGEAERWRDIFRRMTEAEPEPAVVPDQALVGGETLEVAGSELRIHHTGHAHTDSDIMIELPESRVLFTGDIVEHGRAVSSDVPQDFDIAGQIEAIRYALELPVETFVPGHGVTGGREIPEAALRFLEILHAGVQRGYAAGLQDYEMRDTVAADLSEFSDWFGFDELGRLVSFVYRQVEAADFQ